MTPEEFFRVLKDSQLERAFPWYYQTGWPLVAFLSSFVCWLYLLKVSIVRLVANHNDIKARPAVMNPGLAIRTDPAIILDVSRLAAATIALLVTHFALRVQQNPILLLSRVHPSIDSLYDLTPIGVQFVVDFLFWLTLLSLISFFCLWTIAATVIWIEVLRVTPVQWLWNIRSAGPSGKIKGGFQALVLGVPPCLLLLLVLVLDSRFDFTNTQTQISEQAMLLEKCKAQDAVTFVGQSWSETQTGSHRVLNTRLVIRFSQNESLNQMDAFYDLGENEQKKCELSMAPTVDPLDIAIVPVLEPDLDPIQSKFAALVLRELLTQFELGDAMGRDRVQLFLPKPSGIDETGALIWPEAAANALFSYSEDVETLNFNIAEVVRKVAGKLRTRNRKDNVSQAYGPQLIILFRWFPVQQPSELGDADVYKNLLPEDTAEGRQSHIWIVDLVSNSQQSIADNLDSSVSYFKVQIPSVLIDPDTMQMKTEVPRQSLQNGNVVNRIEALRSSRQWELETKQVWASRDSKPIRLFIGEDAECYVDVPFDTPTDGALAMMGVTRVDGPATAKSAFIAVLLLGLIYPVGIILVGLFQSKNRLGHIDSGS